MNFEIKLHAGFQTSDHKLALRPSEDNQDVTGQFTFSLDGSDVRSGDWIEIGPGIYSVILGRRSYEVHVAPEASDPVRAAGSYTAIVGGQEYKIELHDPRARRHKGSAVPSEGPQDILAPMPGRILKVLVEEKQEVEAGQGLLVIEAMKMQNELRAPRPGRVEKIYTSEGLGVETGSKLLRLA